MGRPLNKKYFGNRNTGSASTTADNGIGGGYVSSVTIDTAGSYTTRPTVTFSTPDKTALGAVRATGTVNMEALSATVVDGKTGYVVGDLLTVTGAGGAIAYVATIDGDGTVLTVNFTGTGAARGTQTDLTDITTGVATTTNSVAGTVGVTLDVAYRVKSITITEPGSGYTDATDAAVTFSAGTGAGTVVLGTDTGNVGSATNQENAITMTAYLTGGSALTVDVIKQVSTNRYKVTDGTRTGIVALQGSLANAAGECSILATDSDGGTYYVTKLTAHKAVVTRGTGTQFATGEAIPWTFGTATEDYSVKIANA